MVSSKIKPSDLATLISAFANAEGGTIAIGISDKTKRIEGLHQCDDNKINLFLNAAKDGCIPMLRYEEECIDVFNDIGEKDRILLLHIRAIKERLDAKDLSIEQILRARGFIF